MEHLIYNKKHDFTFINTTKLCGGMYQKENCNLKTKHTFEEFDDQHKVRFRENKQNQKAKPKKKTARQLKHNRERSLAYQRDCLQKRAILNDNTKDAASVTSLCSNKGTVVSSCDSDFHGEKLLTDDHVKRNFNRVGNECNLTLLDNMWNRELYGNSRIPAIQSETAEICTKCTCSSCIKQNEINQLILLLLNSIISALIKGHSLDEILYDLFAYVSPDVSVDKGTNEMNNAVEIDSNFHPAPVLGPIVAQNEVMYNDNAEYTSKNEPLYFNQCYNNADCDAVYQTNQATDYNHNSQYLNVPKDYEYGNIGVHCSQMHSNNSASTMFYESSSQMHDVSQCSGCSDNELNSNDLSKLIDEMNFQHPPRNETYNFDNIVTMLNMINH